MESKDPIIISLVEDEKEREKVISFINKTSLKWYKCISPPPLQELFVAKIGGKIVGTTALDFSDGNELLPLETISKFNRNSTPLPFSRKKIGQFSRLTAIVPYVSSIISYIATLYALDLGRIYGLAMIKGSVIEHQRSLGVELFPISGVKFDMKKILFGEKNYYITPPTPKLFMMNLKQMKEGYSRVVLPLVSKKIISDLLK